MNRVALIQPHVPDGNYLPSIGLLYIASVLKDAGFDPLIYDLNYQSLADILDNISRFKPAVTGITAVTSSVDSSFAIAKEIKRIADTYVVLGGPHPTALPRETVTNQSVDFVIAGEGEYPMRSLCSMLTSNKEAHDLSTIPNLFYKTGGTVKNNKRAQFLSPEELDSLPYPAFDLLNLDYVFKNSAHGLFSKGRRVLPLMSARGCPQTCTFCCRVMGFRPRERSNESVLEEMKFLKKTYDVDEIYFEDDNFTENKPRAMALLNAIKELNLGVAIKFANGLRADKVDRELLVKIKEAGGYYVGFGIESGSSNVLSLMKKDLDLNIVKKNVKLAKSLGFYIGSGCIIGYPGETKRELLISLKYFLKLGLDSCAIVNLVPFPKTPVHTFCNKNGLLTEKAKDYKNYFFNIFSPIILVSTPHLSESYIKVSIKLFYLVFYLHPGRLIRILTFYLKKTFA